jgi:hypothetical protein
LIGAFGGYVVIVVGGVFGFDDVGVVGVVFVVVMLYRACGAYTGTWSLVCRAMHTPIKRLVVSHTYDVII